MSAVEPSDYPYIALETTRHREESGKSTFSRFQTEEADIFIVEASSTSNLKRETLARRFDEYLAEYEALRVRMTDQDLGYSIPEVVDFNSMGQWAALSVPSGMYSLKEIAKSYPDGIDGKHWIWMIRELFYMVLKTERFPLIKEGSLFVNPETQEVLMLDWPNFKVTQKDFLNGVYELGERYLNWDESELRISSFFEHNRKRNVDFDTVLKSFQYNLQMIYPRADFSLFVLKEGLSEPIS